MQFAALMARSGNHAGCRWLPGSAEDCYYEQSQSVVVTGLQKQVWLLLSAILWLGNIEFDSAGDDMVTVRRDEALANAAALLNLDEDELATALSERVLTAGRLFTNCAYTELEKRNGMPLNLWQCHIIEKVQAASCCRP